MAAEIRIVIKSESSGSAIADAKKDVQDLGNTAEKSGKGFSAMREVAVGALRELGAAATNAALGGLKVLGGAVMDVISDAREAAKINAQTAQVLKSTGNAAGVSAEHASHHLRVQPRGLRRPRDHRDLRPRRVPSLGQDHAIAQDPDLVLVIYALIG